MKAGSVDYDNMSISMTRLLILPHANSQNNNVLFTTVPIENVDRIVATLNKVGRNNYQKIT